MIKKIRIMLFIIIVLFQYFFCSKLYISSGFISDIIVLISITFGFYITSITIFSTSKYVSNLYKIMDKNNKNSNLMFTLINKYKVSLIFNFCFILYLLILSFIINQTQNKIAMNSIYGLIFTPLFILSILYSFELLDILIKVIKQEAKLNN